jgi:hypothetical protein
MSSQLSLRTRLHKTLYLDSEPSNPGRSVIGTPWVVKCTWTRIKVENLDVYEGTLEDAKSSKNCTYHPRCKGHLCSSNNAYLIPYGFATGGEIISSVGSMLNQAVIANDKSATDIAEHCYGRIATKSGIMRKSCNGCRPTNTMRFVASPGPEAGLHPAAEEGHEQSQVRIRFR